MKSFLAGKKVLPLAALRATASAAPMAKVAPAAGRGAGVADDCPRPHGGGGAGVAVVKEGDKVVRLVVTCTCGERVEIECLYPAGS